MGLYGTLEKSNSFRAVASKSGSHFIDRSSKKVKCQNPS
ncbi:hypothetical protein PS634_03853 [Pseudomonas fluorescens]|nr:hypothetical protein PS634_03853 [Pseudomonas fluorescens]